MSARTIVAVLGGSSAFLPALAEGLARERARLPALELRLVGRDARRVAAVARAASAVAARQGADHLWVAAEDAGSAAVGATLIVNQIRVGGLRARDRDERLALSHGAPADETLGPAALAGLVRTVPVVLESVRAARRAAPRAALLSLVNPLGAVLDVLRQVPGPAPVGVCELPADTLGRALRRAGVPDADHARVQADWVGLNHRGAFVRVTLDGRELLPALLAANTRAAGDAFFPFEPDELQRLGALPVRHLRLVLHPREEAQRQASAGRTRGAALAELSERLHARWSAGADGTLPDELRGRDMPWIGQAVVPALVALLGGPPATLHASEPNGAHLPELPATAVVEKLARVGAHDTQAVPLTPAGRAAAGGVLPLVRRLAEAEALAVRAALAPDAASVRAALEADPCWPGGPVPDALVSGVLRARDAEEVPT